MAKKTKTENPADAVWDAFKKTGSVSYYRLYKKLTEED